MIYQRIRPLLFRRDPEAMHDLFMRAMTTINHSRLLMSGWKAMYRSSHQEQLTMSALGMLFSSPIGLSGGLDKQGQSVNAFAALGFGYIEVGTVTPLPQPGNPKPRMFRVPEDGAIINRLGFNSLGAKVVAHNLTQYPSSIPLFMNIGKNKATPLDQANDDYITCMRELYSFAHAFVLNISSPNTEGLRSLHEMDRLQSLLQEARDENNRQAAAKGISPKPLLLKLSPDLEGEHVKGIVNLVQEIGIDGFIIANTTVSREGVTNSTLAQETGGLSGKPIMKLSTDMVKHVYSLTEGRIPIIASGGVFSAKDAYDKIRAGASMVQVYTGMIYEGPGLIGRMNRELVEFLEQDGFERVEDAIGSDL